MTNLTYERNTTMTFHSTLGASIVALSFVAATASFAGGPATPAIEVAPAAPAAPKPSMVFSFELQPEFYAADKAGNYMKGDLADTQAKISVSKALPNGLTVAGALQLTAREAGITGVASGYAQLEASTSYKFKLSDVFSLTPSATLGYAFGDQPKVDPLDANAAAAYYAVGLAADYKINGAFTWNVVNIRYRDAFGGNWKTPKLSTGITYKLDDLNSAYANIGKSWKDTGTGYKSDKYSIAFGLKHSF